MEKRQKILLVDDDPIIVQAHRMILEAEGYDVISASGGDEGLELMRVEKPDLVLLDVMMDSILDGVYVSRTMWEDEGLRRIPVVMVSAIASTQYAGQFPQDEYLNAVDFLFKPVKPEDLVACVRRVLK
jgi:CheY-like chemotaxis protein